MAVTQLNDLKTQALRQLGYLDKQLNVNECLFWKTFSNKTEYDDLKKAWLAAIGFNKQTLVDSYYAYLRSQGYMGSIPDMEWKSLIAGTLYFSPLTLFSAGEQGAWYDPSDLSTLFQDSAGTTPVTAVGQPVGKMNDKSGRGNHAIQATSASRPILQQDGSGRYYLACDGIDDGLASVSAIDFTTTDKSTISIGLRKLSDAARASILELGNGVNNSFRVEAPTSAAPNYNFASAGSTSSSITATTFTAPITNIVTGIGSVSTDTAIIRINGVQLGSSITDQGTGNYRNDTLFLFRRGGSSLPFNGNFYGAVIRGAASSASQISQLEAYMNAKTGAF